MNEPFKMIGPDPNNLTVIPIDAKCQEASIFSREKYIPCYAPATYVMHSEKDGRHYYMCERCALTNTRRGMTVVHMATGDKVADQQKSPMLRRRGI